MRTRLSTASHFAFLFAPAMLLLTGCPIWGDGGDPFCDSDRDCPAGRCDFDGRCVLDRDASFPDTGRPDVGTGDAGPVSCRTNGDCATALYCDSILNTCTDSNTCTDDNGCTGGFICDFRDTCVPPVVGACRDTNDCSGGDLCIEGFCREQDTLCQFGYDCSAGQSCVNGACTNLCGTEAQCGSGSSCSNGFCTPTTECSSTTQCGSGDHCVEGRCLPDCQSSSSCSGTADYCGDDMFCRPDWRERPFCTLDTDCTSGSVCRDGACRTPCPTSTDAECRATDPSLSCGAMDLCVSTETPECALSSECTAPEACVNALCRGI